MLPTRDFLLHLDVSQLSYINDLLTSSPVKHKKPCLIKNKSKGADFLVWLV